MLNVDDADTDETSTSVPEVSDTWFSFKELMMQELHLKVSRFRAGQIKMFAKNWSKITNDPWILRSVYGCEIEMQYRPRQYKIPTPIQFTESEEKQIDLEIKSMLEKEIIKPSVHEQGEYISNIFIRQKNDGSVRTILNLRSLNEMVVHRHFKMETLQSALNLVIPGCYMASIDWKDAYYSVPIANVSQKYLKFFWKGTLYCFLCLPNGLSSGPRMFSKLVKPINSHLRKNNHIITSYLDDSLLVGATLSDCRNSVRETVNLVSSLGFTPHPKKSVFEPTHVITYLGFEIDSVSMTIKLLPEKATKLKQMANELINKPHTRIQTVAELLGVMTSSFPGVPLGPLYYRQLENEKALALKINKGNFDASMTISLIAQNDLKWWVTHIEKCSKSLRSKGPQVTIYTDASTSGWGGIIDDNKTGGFWSHEESYKHINELELKAIFLTLRSFTDRVQGKHVLVRCDNVTAVTYVNKMGGRSAACNTITREIMLWCQSVDIILTANHIAGVNNTEADKMSRLTENNAEWMLDPKVFEQCTNVLGIPSVDLFASRLNNQIPSYVSWKPDPYAMACDAFSISWGKNDIELFYAFPPFNLVTKIVNKVINDEATGILVVPLWTTQPWFSFLPRLLLCCPLFLSSYRQVLRHPRRQAEELPRMRLIACLISGHRWKQHAMATSQNEQSICCCLLGDNPRMNNIQCTLKLG